MVNNDSKAALENALEHVSDNRRAFLKRLLDATTAVVALPLIATDVMAQPPPPLHFGIGKGAFGPGPGKGAPMMGKGAPMMGKGAPMMGKGGGGYAGKGGGRGGYGGRGRWGGKGRR